MAIMSLRWMWCAAGGWLVVCACGSGCGGTSANVGAGGNSPDAATDGTVEASSEGGAGDAPSGDSPTGDGPSGADTGTAEGGADAGCTGTGATCRQCCRTSFATGYDKLVVAELTCACKPSVCGPVDAGAADGGADGSDLGVGACASTCGTKSLPDATCDKCLTDATGTAADPGECYTEVSTACEKDTDCVAYVTCATACQ
jgi:hypothetical protein